MEANAATRPTMSPTEPTADVAIELEDGTVTDLQVPEGETILNAAEDAGYDLDFGCREGRCTTCTGRLLDGEVTYVEGPKAVDEEKRAEGYVSLCIATPDGDCRLEVGEHVRIEAFPTVWQHLDDG